MLRDIPYTVYPLYFRGLFGFLRKKEEAILEKYLEVHPLEGPIQVATSMGTKGIHESGYSDLVTENTSFGPPKKVAES